MSLGDISTSDCYSIGVRMMSPSDNLPVDCYSIGVRMMSPRRHHPDSVIR